MIRRKETHLDSAVKEVLRRRVLEELVLPCHGRRERTSAPAERDRVRVFVACENSDRAGLALRSGKGNGDPRPEDRSEKTADLGLGKGGGDINLSFCEEFPSDSIESLGIECLCGKRWVEDVARASDVVLIEACARALW